MEDEVIDAVLAGGIHADAACREPTEGWVVMRNLPDHPRKVVARLVTTSSSLFVLVADTLAELRSQLPPGLVRSEPVPNDLPCVIEIWFAKAGSCGSTCFDAGWD
jgi:hypothetical protein